MGKSISIKKVKFPTKNKKEKSKKDDLKFLKEQPGGGNYLNKIDNLTATEIEKVRERFQENKIRFSEFKSRPLEYSSGNQKIKNPNMTNNKRGELFTIVYNRSFQDMADEILKEIILNRNDTLQDAGFVHKTEDKIEERRELYRRKHGEEMALEKFVRKGQQLQKISTDSFRTNFYVSFIPFDVFSYLDKDLFNNLGKVAIKYIGENKVSVYYPISERKKFKMVLLQDVSEKEIEEYPLKIVGQSNSIERMFSGTGDKKRKLRNMEIVGMDNLEKSVKLLSDHNVDFQGNSIGDDCFLLLIDEIGFKACMQELQVEADELF